MHSVRSALVCATYAARSKRRGRQEATEWLPDTIQVV